MIGFEIPGGIIAAKSDATAMLDSTPAYVCHAGGRPAPYEVVVQNHFPSQVIPSEIVAEVIEATDFISHQEWTPDLERRFQRMAEDKAVNRLNLSKKVEFEKLHALRRRLKYPRTGEEVIAEYKQRMLTRNLVQALAEYVEFHNTANNSRQKAQEKVHGEYIQEGEAVSTARLQSALCLLATACGSKPWGKNHGDRSFQSLS